MKAGGEILLILAAGFAIWIVTTRRTESIVQAWAALITQGGVFGRPPVTTPAPGMVPGGNLPIVASVTDNLGGAAL